METCGRIIIAFALATGGSLGIAGEAMANPPVTREATRTLEQVGTALRGLRDYAVEMDVSTRAALGNGNYRDFTGTVHYIVRPPSHLFARIEGQGVDREVYYDGQTITVYAPLQRVHARIEAPGTIATLLEQVRARTGIELPIADLFAWGTADGMMSGATRGEFAGARVVRGRECEHYSYREAGVSWEVWIDDRYLPCKLVMVDTSDPGLPGYRADIAWSAATKSSDADFRFIPASGVEQVDPSRILELDQTPGEQP